MAFMIKASIIISFAFSICLVVDIAFAIYKWIRQRKHRRKADARIIAQAKGAGVWDKTPIVLGGRALELKAWEDFKIKREPGEPDAHLRRRYIALDSIMREIAEATQVPLEILQGEYAKSQRFRKALPRVKSVFVKRDGDMVKVWERQPEKKERHDEIDALLTASRAANCAAFKVSHEILYGRSKKDTQDKGESGNE